MYKIINRKWFANDMFVNNANGVANIYRINLLRLRKSYLNLMQKGVRNQKNS